MFSLSQGTVRKKGSTPLRLEKMAKFPAILVSLTRYLKSIINETMCLCLKARGLGNTVILGHSSVRLHDGVAVYIKV